jgi:hypothetical protein
MAEDLPDDSDPKPGEVIGGSTGTIAQLTDDTSNDQSASKGRRRKSRSKRRPIGFQLGELGHLDRPVKDGE